jgi:transcription elongation factor GreB
MTSDLHDEDVEEAAAQVGSGKNYMTPAGHARLRAELQELLRVERTKVVEIVSWAAGNGDRSENGDYLYGKKRLREIDHRIRFLGKRLEIAEVVDPARQANREQVFFGATVTYANQRDEERTITILGVDEADIKRGEVSLHAPVARALMRARVGDVVKLPTPSGMDELEILGIRYPDPS